MAQEKLTIDDTEVKQPESGLGYDFETTYTSSSARTRNGKGHFKPLFTVESFSYEAKDLTKAEMKTILQLVVGRSFTLHYLSPYYGKWRDDTFYVGKGSMNIGSWKSNSESYESLSFNMIGVNPID